MPAPLSSESSAAPRRRGDRDADRARPETPRVGAFSLRRLPPTAVPEPSPSDALSTVARPRPRRAAPVRAPSSADFRAAWRPGPRRAPLGLAPSSSDSRAAFRPRGELVGDRLRRRRPRPAPLPGGASSSLKSRPLREAWVCFWSFCPAYDPTRASSIRPRLSASSASHRLAPPGCALFRPAQLVLPRPRVVHQGHLRQHLHAEKVELGGGRGETP